MRKFVDAQLLAGVEASGGRIYRTHGLGYVLRRTGAGHTWQRDDEEFRRPDIVASEWTASSRAWRSRSTRSTGLTGGGRTWRGSRWCATTTGGRSRPPTLGGWDADAVGDASSCRRSTTSARCPTSWPALAATVLPLAPARGARRRRPELAGAGAARGAPRQHAADPRRGGLGSRQRLPPRRARGRRRRPPLVRRRHARLPRGGRGARALAPPHRLRRPGAGTSASSTPRRCSELDPAVVRDRVAAGESGELFPGQEHEPHQWVEDYWAKTDDLREAGPRAQRFHIGMTGSVTQGALPRLRRLRPHPAPRRGHGSSATRSPRPAASSSSTARRAAGTSAARRCCAAPSRSTATTTPTSPTSCRRCAPSATATGAPTRCPTSRSSSTAGPADETIRPRRLAARRRRPRPPRERRRTVVDASTTTASSRSSDPVLETRLVHRTYLHEPRVRAGRGRAVALRRRVRADPPRRLARPAAAHAVGGAARRPRAHPPRRRVLSYDSGAAARLERTSAAGPRRLASAGPTRREALLEESFGVKTYPATSVGWVPVAEREVARFVLGARPPMDPDEVGDAAGARRSTRPTGDRATRPAWTSPRIEGGAPSAGLFGRRR